MKSITKYVLIIFMVFRASYEVQGQTDRDGIVSKGRPVKRPLENIVRLRTPPLRSADPALQPQTDEEYTLSQTSDGDKKTLPALSKIYTKQNGFKAAKHFDADISLVAQETSVIKSPAVRPLLPSQRIYCRQITQTEVNHEGHVIESIRHICAALPTTTEPPPATLPSHLRRDRTLLGRRATTTPRGINCRRVMNSELNELGEIVDSVTEVCDAPTTTTTTTTTKRPILTTRPTTTTPVPLVKVCRPVMDSYLNEEGKIIDSVAIYCKMEEVH